MRGGRPQLAIDHSGVRTFPGYGWNEYVDDKGSRKRLQNGHDLPPGLFFAIVPPSSDVRLESVTWSLPFPACHTSALGRS